MPPTVSDEKLGEALLESVKHGSFPQSEQLASASVPATAIPKLLEVVGRARDETKNSIRQTSREAASDVDGWIAQARKLQGDIKRSQDTAREIVQQSEAGRDITARVQDATSKVSLLYAEIDYNESLVHVVERLQDISALLDASQDAAVHGNIIHALERLEDADDAFRSLEAFENTRVVGVLKTRAKQLKAALVENMTESWNALLVVDATARRVSFRETIERDTNMAIDTVVEALTKLGLLDGFIATLSRNFDKVVVSPRLSVGTDQVVSKFDIQGDDIQVDGHMRDMRIKSTLEDIHQIAEYLSTRLPPSIAIPLSAKLVPVIANRLISNWLLPQVPLSTDGVPQFQETLSFVLGLAEYLDELEWTGQDRLRDWVDKSAEIWLAKQKEAAIARVHALCPKRVREKKTVERVETQMVSKDDAVLAHQDDQEEDWGQDWGEEEQPEKEEQPQDIEEEDMSAWNDEEDTQEEPQAPETSKKLDGADEEEDVDAWGWGDEADEDETQPTTSLPPIPQVPSQPKTTSKAAPPQEAKKPEKQVTLRETYTVTGIPDAIMEIILQVITDVQTLNQPSLSTSAITPASIGLYSIPSLLLAMYRATASSHYAKDAAANMLIYNDCTRLSDRLRTYIDSVSQQHDTSNSNIPPHLHPSLHLRNLSPDLRAIDTFGRRAYGREMEAQRTIIRDLLDGAQGFQSCTTPPFASECDNAVAMAVDRIVEVKQAWQGVLSASVLLQSLGSLVGTAIGKFVADVEDLTDISEAESRRLGGYCRALGELAALFVTSASAGEAEPEGEAVGVAGTGASASGAAEATSNSNSAISVYTPNWFKFQYLAEILDASLADIRYFWSEGELSLEMGAEEVCDLIRALFAESEYRRKAVAEIRGGRGR